ncbi:MAG: 3-deoxy-8-phosphooctulonate synthase [Candidatus Cloacimonetes bacterium]|nr:3-deoxy-8-phosphooctulonate synthase [Candidatus Cloacimonadota bacterium]
MMDLYQQLLHTIPFFLIAGPCVVEDNDTMNRIAEHLSLLGQQYHLNVVFKASYKKANRTAETSYRGPGLDEGLSALSRIKDRFGLPLLTDVHESVEVAAVAEVVDVIQIPAFLCRQTELIHAAAETGKIVNIKKGQFMAAEDMLPAIEKATAVNNHRLILTERGTTFGYHDLVVDFRGFGILKSSHYPVVYDVTHSLQKPSLHRVSGGAPEYALMMASAAMATNMVDGLFIETHPQPMDALSDSASMVPLTQINQIIETCMKIKAAVKQEYE